MFDNYKLFIKRSEVRLPAPTDFVMKVVDGPDCDRFVKGFNISPHGCCVLSKEHLPGSTQVMLQLDYGDVSADWIPATVMHSTQTIGGYKIGFQFDL